MLATGAWSGRAKWLPAGRSPAGPPGKGADSLSCVLHLTPCRARESSPPNAVYLVPRADGRVFVGATVEERGFDTAVTAGAVYELLREAYRLLPDVAEMELVEAMAGLRPATPDNLPLIGPGALDGLILATGHYRNGILLAPLTADAVAELLDGGRLPDAAAAATPQRFAGEALGKVLL